MVWTSLAAAAVFAADIYDAPIGDVWRNGGVWTVVTQTRIGQVWSLRFALGVLLAALLALKDPARRGRLGGIAVVLAIGILIGPAWTGHAGAFALASDALHLLATGVWVGGLLPLAMLLDCARREKQLS